MAAKVDGHLVGQPAMRDVEHRREPAGLRGLEAQRQLHLAA